MATVEKVEEEIALLVREIKRLGKPNSNGKYSVTFKTIFNDEQCANIFEALVGTLKAAKKRKVIDYQGQILLQGVSDNVEIVLLVESFGTTEKESKEPEKK
ncbi:hypothetical protein RFI_09392 [Reticulomyxa filosa]|uniref:Costars domain-containing protein n=1 Tax=Reticulomyxa filosa TaxID=46433 RepID=X6NP86_RETFI|nr:hypothetical protein RFI_09392 [Reticulomyxa filosa]|eukprot:ETO27738.1 hypothetical protein RFI_09392 [Reticulomyxa filosa]